MRTSVFRSSGTEIGTSVFEFLDIARHGPEVQNHANRSCWHLKEAAVESISTVQQ